MQYKTLGDVEVWNEMPKTAWKITVLLYTYEPAAAWSRFWEEKKKKLGSITPAASIELP